MMNHKNDHKESGCCGGKKQIDHSSAKKEAEKEKSGCCDGEKVKKPNTNKTEKKGGCCGNKN